MSNLKDYVVEKTLNWNEYIQEVDDSKDRIPLHLKSKTDVFNKSSKTTVCFKAEDDVKVMHCENCKETHYDNMDMILELRNYDGKKRYNVTSVICKKCGSSYDMEDIKTISYYNGASNSDVRLVYDKIYNEGDLVKLSIKSCTMVVRKHFYSADNRYKLIFNTKTGQTYIYSAPENKKSGAKFITLNLPISNITYKGYIFDIPFSRCLIDTENQDEYKLNLLKEMYSIIYEKISRNLGYNPKSLEEYAKEVSLSAEDMIYNVSTIALYNRYPNMNPFLLKEMNDGCRSSICMIEPLVKMKEIKNTSKDPLRDLLNAYNVKNIDVFLKYIKENPMKIYDVIYYSKFFKDSSYIEKILDEKHCTYFCYSALNLNNLTKRKYSCENAITKFLNDASKEIGDEDLYFLINNCLINSVDKDTLFDFAEHYLAVKKINPKLKLDLNELTNALKVAMEESKEEEGFIFSNKKVLKKEAPIRLLVKKLNDSLYEKYKDSFNFKIKTVDEYYNDLNCEQTDREKYNIIISSLYNSAPTFNPYVLSVLLDFRTEFSSYGCAKKIGDLSVLNYINPLSTNVLGDIFKYYKLPNVKSLRNTVLDNPESFKKIVYYSSIFSDTNIINNIVCASEKMHYNSLKDIESLISGNVNYNTLREADKYKFIKYLVKKQGEVIAGRKIVDAYKNGTSYYMADIGGMQDTHEALYKTDEIDVNGNIKDIHDRLVRLTGGAHQPLSKKDLKPYKYSDEVYNLSYKKDGYSFKLAKDARELISIGADLHNCVGSYRSYVKAGRSLIVYVMHEGEYKVCIELNPIKKGTTRYILKQAKLDYNKPVYLDKNILDIVTNWMEINNIENGCSDIEDKFEYTSNNRNPYRNVVFDYGFNNDFEPCDEDDIPF